MFPTMLLFVPSLHSETLFCTALLLPKTDSVKGISPGIHLSSTVLSRSAKNDKSKDFKLLIRINPESSKPK